MRSAPGRAGPHPRVGSDPSRASRERAFLIVALLLVAFSLRTTVTSLPPFASEIRRDLGLSSTAVGLLTSLPLLCMAGCGAGAHRLGARWGREATTLAALACVAGGNGLRLAGDHVALLFAATLLAGIGVAACGVLLPGIVKASFPRRAGAATGACSVAMMLGAATAGALAVPLGQLLGSWEASLAFWLLPALPALALWGAVVVRNDGPRAERPAGSMALPWRAPAAWQLAAFFALQASVSYAYIAWLPPRYEALGWTAGAAGSLLGVLNLAQMPTALLLPVLADRSSDRRPALLGAVALTVVAAVWLFALPDVLPWLATTLVGLGLGGGFSLTLVLIVDYAADAGSSSGLAAMVFLVGYSAAALAPIAIGALHDRSGGYRVPFAALALLALAQLTTATRLGPRHRGTVRQLSRPARCRAR
jgi:MFS transporter, CP family, cyanate transporter